MLLGECTGCLVLFPLHSSPHVTVWSGSGCAVADWERWTLLFSTRAHHHPSLQITHSEPPPTPPSPCEMYAYVQAQAGFLPYFNSLYRYLSSAGECTWCFQVIWVFLETRCEVSGKKILTFIEYIVYYPSWLWINKNIQDNVSKRFMIYIYLL